MLVSSKVVTWMSCDAGASFPELGNLPLSTLLTEVKRLHDVAYELGIEERKEMTRGKYLNIFKRK